MIQGYYNIYEGLLAKGGGGGHPNLSPEHTKCSTSQQKLGVRIEAKSLNEALACMAKLVAVLFHF